MLPSRADRRPKPLRLHGSLFTKDITYTLGITYTLTIVSAIAGYTTKLRKKIDIYGLMYRNCMRKYPTQFLFFTVGCLGFSGYSWVCEGQDWVSSGDGCRAIWCVGYIGVEFGEGSGAAGLGFDFAFPDTNDFPT